MRVPSFLKIDHILGPFITYFVVSFGPKLSPKWSTNLDFRATKMNIFRPILVHKIIIFRSIKSSFFGPKMVHKMVIFWSKNVGDHCGNGSKWPIFGTFLFDQIGPKKSHFWVQKDVFFDRKMILFRAPKTIFFGLEKKSFSSLENHFPGRKTNLIFDQKCGQKWKSAGKEIHFQPPKSKSTGKEIDFLVHFDLKMSLKSTKMVHFCLIFGQKQPKIDVFGPISSKSAGFWSKSTETDRNLPDLELARARASLSQALARAILARKAPIVALLARARVLKHRALGLAGLRCASPRGYTRISYVLAWVALRFSARHPCSHARKARKDISS